MEEMKKNTYLEISTNNNNNNNASFLFSGGAIQCIP